GLFGLIANEPAAEPMTTAAGGSVKETLRKPGTPIPSAPLRAQTHNKYTTLRTTTPARTKPAITSHAHNAAAVAIKIMLLGTARMTASAIAVLPNGGRDRSEPIK